MALSSTYIAAIAGTSGAVVILGFVITIACLFARRRHKKDEKERYCRSLFKITVFVFK